MSSCTTYIPFVNLNQAVIAAGAGGGLLVTLLLFSCCVLLYCYCKPQSKVGVMVPTADSFLKTFITKQVGVDSVVCRLREKELICTVSF